MAIYFQPNLCAVADIPIEYDDFYKSPDFAVLKLKANKLGLNISFLVLDGLISVLTIGKPLNTSFGYFENQLISLNEFKKYERQDEDIKDVQLLMRQFLNSLEKKHTWISYLNWSEVQVMFYTHS